MAMTNRNNAKLDCMIYYTLDELVPQDHLVRKMEDALDFRFIYPKVQHLYSRHGRPSIDPVVLFKMLIIKYRVWNQFYAQDMSGDRSQLGISLVSWIKY